MGFADPKSDVAFKKIFGNENRREILVSFLNAVLDLPEGKRVVDVEILTPYQAPRLEGLKESTLDVRAKDQRGVQYIVEMQVQKRAGFRRRVLYYSSRAYAGQIKAAEDYPKLNQVIFIGICNFDIFETTDYLSRHLILEKKTLKQELKDLEFNFIELTKFNKSLEELEGVIEQWIFFLKNAPELQLIPDNVSDPGLKAAYETANKFQWTEQELEVYDYWSMRSRDELGSYEAGVEDGIEKGIEQGIEKGIEQGLEQGKLETARKMLEKGISLNDIQEITGLSVEQLEKAGAQNPDN